MILLASELSFLIWYDWKTNILSTQNFVFLVICPAHFHQSSSFCELKPVWGANKFNPLQHTKLKSYPWWHCGRGTKLPCGAENVSCVLIMILIHWNTKCATIKSNNKRAELLKGRIPTILQEKSGHVWLRPTFVAIINKFSKYYWVVYANGQLMI